MLVGDCTISPLYALRKDHKRTVDSVVGPPVRPVCGAVSAYNRKLSHLMSFILAEVWKEVESVCMNTEEMLADFKRVNEIHITEDIIIGSADVKALYPSLDVAFTVEKACEVFYASNVQVVGVNVQELGLYLALSRTESELNELGLLPFCPRHKSKRGRPPTITGCAMNECKEKRFGPWLTPTEEPDEGGIRRMFKEALKVVLLFIMENHIYTFDNQIKLQSKGGPIGLELTGVLAQLFMVWWDRQFMWKMEEFGMKLWMYKRYVDDINIIMTTTKPGLKFANNEMVDDESVTDTDRREEADKRCMLLVKLVGDSIHSSIEIEVDYPSRYEDRKLPILDLKVHMERKERVIDGRKQNENVVLHEFYSKNVASKCVINARSALSWSSKRTILTQEVLRILLNCNIELPWEVAVGHVNHMMLRLQFSGYNQKFRTEVVKSALNAYNNILMLHARGDKPMYRPRQWRYLERVQEKRRKREDWYKEGGYDTVIFVPATPDSTLKRRYEKDIRVVGVNIKVVEQSGMTLKRVLQRSDPFKDKVCQRPDCLICRTGGRGSCSTTSVTYELVCQVCGRKYVGQTSRSAYIRGKEHLDAMDQRKEKSVMWKHIRDVHGGDIVDFSMNVTGTFHGDAMLRQITESVLINKTPDGQLLNSKSEWNYIHIPRAVITED